MNIVKRGLNGLVIPAISLETFKNILTYSEL